MEIRDGHIKKVILGQRWELMGTYNLDGDGQGFPRHWESENDHFIIRWSVEINSSTMKNNNKELKNRHSG